MKKIEMLIESDNGHDTKLVPENNIPLEVSKELENDKWVTVKKTDGTTDVLTKADAPKKDDWKNSFAKPVSKTVDTPSKNKAISKSVVDNFVSKFDDVESVMVTKKAKGG